MKKMIILLMAALLLTGCGKAVDNKEEKEPAKTEDTSSEKEEPVTEEPEKEAESEDPAAEVPEELPLGQSAVINVYSIDEATGEMVAQAVTCEEFDAMTVWDKLQEKGVIPQEAEMLAMITDSDGLTLDTAASFGEHIRGLGTNEENEVLKCITYTYLEAFAYDKIQFTEEGEILVTGHRELEGYKRKEDYK